MGSKSSKVGSSSKPRLEDDGGGGSGSKDESNHQPAKRAEKTLAATTKSKVKVRRRTLDPLSYHSTCAQASALIEERLRNSSVNIKNKLTDSRLSLRSDASASDASWFTDNSSVELIDYESFEYPFENVVFEGGGNKGLAYAGAISEFERIGVWKNIKRLGGASAGAMTATLMAIGYNSSELKEFLSLNLQNYFLDAFCGSCSLLPNLIRHFGWHPARRLFEWFGDRLEEKTGDADITFKQLYDTMGKELCIVVTNLNQMAAEYCHVKTTPHMPIRIAVRMSLAIPGLFGAVKSQKRGSSDYYIDGGVLCNYPIHCFDGWWLSMKPEDSMLRRLQPLEDIGRLWDKNERFGTVNPKTIGLVLYSSDEQDVMVSKLQKRKMHNVRRPKTKLSQRRKHIKEIKDAAVREHNIITAAMSSFLRLLAESDIDESGTISRKELIQAFEKDVDYFSEGQRRTLFGQNYKVEDIFRILNRTDDDEITFHELQAFAERRGVEIQTSFEGYGRREIRGFKEFLGALTETLLVNVKRIFTTDGDISRTIGIDTVYVDTTDFKLEEGDMEFLIQQGERAVRSYLRHYVRLHDPPLKKELRGGSTTESTLPYKDSTKAQLTSDPDTPIKNKQGSIVLSRSNLNLHTLQSNSTSNQTASRSPREISSLDGGPPILLTQPSSGDIFGSRGHLPPLRGSGQKSPKTTRRSPRTKRRSRTPSERSPSLISTQSALGESMSPRANDGEQLVRVRRGTRISLPSDVSNIAYDSYGT